MPSGTLLLLTILWFLSFHLLCVALSPPLTSSFLPSFSLRAQVAKNKIAPPFRIVEMDILFGTGIDTVSCLLDAAEDAGIFTRKGSWYSYEGKNVSQVRQLVPYRSASLRPLAFGLQGPKIL